jgi:hypothetical protein
VILRRQKADKPDFQELNSMVAAMRSLLENSPQTALTLEELLGFQDADGSFRLLEGDGIPSDARVDFCSVPTYCGAAILMKEYLSGKRYRAPALARALAASLACGLVGHGYEAEQGRIAALRVFIKGGLRQFLEAEWELYPEFHNKVHKILHDYRTRLLRGGDYTKGSWNEDYRLHWQEIADQLKLSKRLYIAYGSNMDRDQMERRCPGAKVVGPTYLHGWALTMPHFANIEKHPGRRTPALVWEITSEHERALDRCEGYPTCYSKVNIIVNVAGKLVSAMAYVMTDEYKSEHRSAREEYREQILKGYRDAGFDEEEFHPVEG